MYKNYNNPYIKVVWEDVIENITPERIKRIKSYFKEKYNTKFVFVQPKIKGDISEVTLKNVNISENINDFQYQKKLINDFIEENKIKVDVNLIDRLDNKVNEKLVKTVGNRIKYNKWEFKSVEFSNFLSFGDNNKIDFENLNGITVVESTPKNFGGKTIMTTDLFLFLFFNTTTKTKTNAEIFNLYSDSDVVSVKGHIVIDNEDYIITRTLTRKLSKSGAFNIKSQLEYHKILNGEIVNLTDEQRRQTENLITNAIGEQEDFLHTILTTSNNLEDLIDAKPTPRGQILTRFLGLDTIREKEEVCKSLFSEWSKNLVSNIYNVQELTNNNEQYNQDILNLNEKILIIQKNLEDNNVKITELIDTKETLLSLFSKDIDPKLMKLNVNELQLTNENILKLIEKIKLNISNLDVVEPTTFYDETNHKKVQEEYGELKQKQAVNVALLREKNKELDSLTNQKICPVCGKEMDNDKHEKEIITIINTLNDENIQIKNKLKDIEIILSDLEEIRNSYLLYEKNKLIKAKYELEIEQNNSKFKNNELLINNFEQQRKKIEKNQEIEIKLLSLKSKIESLNGEVNIQTRNISTHKSEISNLSLKIEDNVKLIEKIKAEEAYLIIFKTYLSIFGKNGLSKMVLKNMIPVINNELGKLLSDSSYFNVELNINEKNEVEFLMIDNETRKIKLLSTGSGYEKTISSLALRSIMSRISSLPKPNIIIMDEVFGKVADENIELVGEFFNKIKDYFDNILLITHNPLIKNWADNVIIISKSENISKIESITTKF